jgi:hypothetical protein
MVSRITVLSVLVNSWHPHPIQVVISAFGSPATSSSHAPVPTYSAE